MTHSRDSIAAFYKETDEDARAGQSRYAALEFEQTVRHLAGFIRPSSRVLELGCGTGWYALHFAGACKEYTGIDLIPQHIARMNEKARARGLRNVHGLTGDATRLTGINDHAFDTVLCLGPMYHLPPEERKQVFAECRRVCKSDGMAAFAYLNRTGVYAGACVHDRLRGLYPNEEANRAVLEAGTDDVRPDVFFYTMPEEIEAEAREHGFRKIRNLGTDFFIMRSVIDGMDDRKMGLLRPLLDQMCSHESCTGMSNHALLICKRGG